MGGVAALRWRGVEVRWIVGVIIASSVTRGWLWAVYLSIRMDSRGWFRNVRLLVGLVGSSGRGSDTWWVSGYVTLRSDFRES